MKGKKSGEGGMAMVRCGASGQKRGEEKKEFGDPTAAEIGNIHSSSLEHFSKSTFHLPLKHCLRFIALNGGKRRLCR
jgi:hypothetical protein